ncbi:glycosyltransferase family 4 protein [Sphingomonas abietis]|uniref:Glycosyltransferase family 1 protein n=1 Tax=Sphingomonas abietis TaxID=3012344 RepID=A0ABY7NJF5_9SPHN|nr:glycosyltransferase family 1 protein [Sphingomonas abietis]WBO21670.1 glycosyltransferase family 1 protein [Sphingomonas abietis]
MDVTDLRVALFSGNYNYVRDGANQALNRLVEYLLRKGAAVRIYSPKVSQPAFDHVGDLIGVPAIPLPGRAEYRAPILLTPGVKKDIHRFKPNIIHVASPEVLGHAAVRHARKNKLPVVASVHTRFETYPRYYGFAFLEGLVEAGLRRFYRRCDAIFAPSESMAQLLREQRMNFDVGIWSRGVERDIFSPERRDLDWRRGLGIADDEVAVGYIGRLVMEKGLDVFADTIDQLVRRGVKHRVLIVGDGPAREWFEKRLPDDAVFAGFQGGKDLGRAAASMDVLFNPSVTETFGNVTLEAMSAGIPVVAADATGSQSLVEPGITGELVRPGAIHFFADALGRYVQNDELRHSAGHAGRIASRAYEWDKVNQALVDQYLRIERQRQRGIAGTPPMQRVPWPGSRRS